MGRPSGPENIEIDPSERLILDILLTKRSLREVLLMSTEPHRKNWMRRSHTAWVMLHTAWVMPDHRRC